MQIPYGRKKRNESFSPIFLIAAMEKVKQFALLVDGFNTF